MHAKRQRDIRNSPPHPHPSSLSPQPRVAARLNELTLRDNIPAAVTIELTRQCLLACAHCYLPETQGRSRARTGRELSTAQWKKILDQLAGAGAIYLVFTGGEPLLRPDLAELCLYAKKLKFDIRIYSSGLGLTSDMAAALKQAGISAFELSVYGRPAAHDKVTGRAGSFSETMTAAELLKKNGIAVKLKTPLMRSNFKDLPWLLRLAKHNGYGISFDPVIAPANDGDKTNLSLRLRKPDLAAVMNTLSSLISHPSSLISHPSSLDFLCGAGRNVAAIDPYGNLSPCLQLPVKLGNVFKTQFKELWQTSAWLKKWRALKTGDLKECRDCARLSSCNRCPGISLLEEDDVLAPNRSACEMAELQGREQHKMKKKRRKAASLHPEM